MNIQTVPNAGFPAQAAAAPQSVDATTLGSFNQAAANTQPMWNMGVDATGAGAGMTGAAANTFAGMAGVAPGSLATTDYSKYMNPYTQNVVDTSMTELQKQQDIQTQKVNAAATAAGAFGGDRNQIQLAQMGNDFNQTRKDAIAKLYQAGFGNAQDAAKFDINNATGREAAGAAGLAGVGGQTSGLGADFLKSVQGQLNTSANMGFGWGEQLNQDQMAAGGAQQTQQQQIMDAINKQMAGYTGQGQTAAGIASGNMPSPGGSGTSTTTNSPSVAGILASLAGAVNF